MQDIIISIMNQFGYFGILFLIAAENLFPPIPSEVILTFGGFVTTVANLHTTGVIAAATAGSLIGAVVLYALGYLLKADRLMQMAEGTWGKRLHLKAADIQKAQSWFLKHGYRTVFFCRFVPVIRSLISLPAGMANMPLFPFLLFTTLGSLIWNGVLVYAGKMAGDHWETIVSYISVYSKGVLMLGGIAVLLWASWFLYRKRKKTIAK